MPLVDDDSKLQSQVKSYLERQGYEVHATHDGGAVLDLFLQINPDMVILDIVLPDPEENNVPARDGITILREIRKRSTVPVLILSVVRVPSIVVMALTTGADDYLVKPFNMEELHARIEAILRRANNEVEERNALELNRLKLDPGERRVWKDGKPIPLTKREFDMLYALARRPDHVFTRDKLLDTAWEEPSYCVPKVVDVHIRSIHKKIEDNPEEPEFIETVRGIGYRFIDVAQKPQAKTHSPKK